MTTRKTYFVQGLVYEEIVRFSQQIRRYFNIFGRERVHVMIYDDFATDIVGVYRRALDFLEVDSTRIVTDFEPVNANKFVKSGAVRDLFSDPLVRRAVLAIRPLVPRAMFSVMQKVDARVRKMNSRDGERPMLSPELRERLNRQFATEVEQLSMLLDRDLTHWSRNCGPQFKVKAASQAEAATIASAGDCAEAVQNLNMSAGDMRLDAYS